MMFIWIFVDYKYVFVSLVAIALGWSHLTGFVNMSVPSKSEGDLRVMSYNISNGYSIRDKDSLRQVKKIKLFHNYLSSIKIPDVICLQESNYVIEDIISEIYKDHKIFKIGKKGAVIFSKLHIISGGQIDFGTRTNSCVYIDIEINEKIIRVYNMHLQSNQISKDADLMLESTDMNEPEMWNSVKGIVGKYRKASKKRSIQAKKVKAHSLTSPYPVILVGDINDPPTSFTYSMLSKGVLDAFHEKGSGIGTTYGGSIPMLRIDYILASEGLKVASYDCKKEKFSDHYPIFAEISL